MRNLFHITQTAMLALIGGLAYSQTQYSLSHYAKADSVYITSIASGPQMALANFLQTGNNYQWNFADLEITTQRDYRFKTPNNSGYYQSFLLNCLLNGGTVFTCASQWSTTSNLAKSQNEGLFLVEAEIENYTEFQKTSTQRVEATMIGVTIKSGGSSIPITVRYTTPDVLMKFPMAVSNKDSSISGFSSNFAPLGYNLIVKRWQKRVNRIDGWGSLVTPYASFSQTLRMLTRIERIDTLIYEGDTLALPTTEILAQWWSPTHGQPVLVATGTNTEAGIVFSSASFIDRLRCLEPQVLFASYPVQPTIDATQRFVDVTFVNLTQNATHYQWNFDDPTSGSANTSTLKNPTHRYTSGGPYQVKLTARNQSSACSVPLESELVLPLLVADTANVSASFTYSPENPTPNQQVQFTSQTQNAYSFLWNFGNGSTSAERNPAHSYSEPGQYSVTLTASNTTKSETYSSTISILATSIGADTMGGSISVWPNPTSGKVSLSLPGKISGSVTIAVHSLLGTKLTEKMGDATSGSIPDVDLSGLGNGMYAITVTANGLVYKGLVVKR